MSGAGFTLIELLVAVAIIGVLAGSLFFVLNPGEQLAKTRDARRKSDFYQIRNALDVYYGDYNRYPSSVSGKIQGTGTQGIDWGGQWQSYMPVLPKDPVESQSYYYEAAGDGSSYRLYAKLERCSDVQVIPGSDCNNYNYAVTSTNVSVVPFAGSNSSIPTSVPVPTVSAGATATPIPTSAPVPTSTPVPTPVPTAIPTPATPAGPAEHPIQDKGLMSGVSSNRDFNVGHKFTVNRNGRITQLWNNCDAGTRTVRLYSVNIDGTTSELRSIDIAATGQTNWVSGDLINPVNVTAGTSFIVAVRNGTTATQCWELLTNLPLPFALPFTIGSVTINAAGYIFASDSAPSSWGTNVARGLVDITFVPTN